MTDLSTKHLASRLRVTVFDTRLGPPKTVPRELYYRCRCDITPFIEQIKKTADSFAVTMQMVERLHKLKLIGLLNDEALTEIKEKAQEKGDPIFLLDQIIDAPLSINGYMVIDIARHLESNRLLELGEQLKVLSNKKPFSLCEAQLPGAPRNRAERRKKAVGRKGGAAGERKNWKRKAFYE